MSADRFDVLIDLEAERIAWQPLHEALEVLDEAGFEPHRFHVVPGRALAEVDLSLGGTFGARLAGRGAWLLRCKADPTRGVIGCAGYGDDARDPAVGLAGPFVLDGDLVPFRETILLGTLFSLRERGYRLARVPRISAGALERLRGAYGSAIVRATPVVPPEPIRTVVCASGTGSNFQAVIDAVASGRLSLDLAHLVVNRRNAYALERAAAAGIPSSSVLWDRASETREGFDARVEAAVAAPEPRLVLLLGWMHLLPPKFTRRFSELLNVHPAYLPLDPAVDEVELPDGSSQPAFRGARAVDDALAAGARWIGASVHRVTDETDRGAILARAPLSLRGDEPRAEIDARLHLLEHRVLADALETLIYEL